MRKENRKITLNSLHAKLFLLYAVFFSKLNLIIKIFQSKSISTSNSLDPDQARHFVGPDLGPNCLQRLSAEDKRRIVADRKHSSTH